MLYKTIIGHTSLLMLLTIFAFVSCEKLDVLPETPSCIKKKIRQMKRAEVRNPPGSIWQFRYNDQIIYYIPPYCCDIPSELLDDKCNLICKPDGGFTGKGDGQCDDFYGKRIKGVLIWQDNR